MRTFVLGDIHGAYRALVQCFERSGFDPGSDRLIFIGDAVDGWSESPQSVEALRDAKQLVYLLGNHDLWLLDWLLYDEKPLLWRQQGGDATMRAYRRLPWSERIPEHIEFLSHYGRFHFLDESNRLFVHGGIEAGLPLDKQEPELEVWDRDLFYETGGVPPFREVYIGHTPTINFESTEPVNFGAPDNVWRIDTGAGWSGRLTIMDVDTKQFWQSDVVADLYPGEKGRG